MSTLFQGHFVQFFDDNGKPLSGGTVEFFEVGTSTPKDVYSDASLSTPAGSTVTLDSAGKATIWLNGDYKARLKKSDGSVVKTTDGINPPVETETSGGNLIANGSFEDAGNSATQASGWTLTAQNDGTVERITSDNYDGQAALKFTSVGNGGGQADTDAFFAVSPGRSYEISFALKCSVADIRNIVQVRYFDEDQIHLSNSTVYDEDTSNPTSWEVKSFTDTPPINARFAKVRILGADQSDATSGDARFDRVSVSSGTIPSDSDNNVFGYGQKIAFKTADFTLSADENGKNIDCEKATDFEITVPSNSSVSLPVGYTCSPVQAGAGQVVIVEGAGVTVRTSATLKSKAQWAAMTLYKRATDEWVLLGERQQ